MPTVPMHIPTVSFPSSTLIPALPQSRLQSVPTPGLSPTEWSTLISKVQAEGQPTFIPNTPDVTTPLGGLPDPLPLTKIFTVKAACFSLNPEPGTLLDCLMQMALNHFFMPVSMLTTSALNNIETNQDVKYKCLTYGLGIGKTFLDKMSFPTEDQLSYFKFGQVYTNWLTLIKSVSEPTVELGSHEHHK